MFLICEVLNFTAKSVRAVVCKGLLPSMALSRSTAFKDAWQDRNAGLVSVVDCPVERCRNTIWGVVIPSPRKDAAQSTAAAADSAAVVSVVTACAGELGKDRCDLIEQVETWFVTNTRICFTGEE